MALGNFLFGTPSRTERIQRYDPQQVQTFNQLLSMGLEGLQNPTAGFAPIEQYARNQFQQQTIPGLAERFTSMGGRTSLTSGPFTSQLGSASADLESQLAALKAQYGQNQQAQLLQLLGLGLTPQYEIAQLGQQPGVSQGFGDVLGKFGPLALGALPGAGWLDRFKSLLGALGGNR